MNANIVIPTYIINLAARTDRLGHIQEEFEGRTEFLVNLVKAEEHPIGAIGLWKTILKILKDQTGQTEDYIIICEDDHRFTPNYSADILFTAIDEAGRRNADLLLGGVSWFRDAVQVSDNLFWVEKFSGLQFTIIFRKFFEQILATNFGDTDAADFKLSALTPRKLFIHPFISEQRDFGYSDVTSKNNMAGRVENLFIKSAESVECLKEISRFYNYDRNSVKSTEPSVDFSIPTYVINIPRRTERLEHIKHEFAGRTEFDLKIFPACEHNIGAVGLWNSIRKIVEISIEEEDDVIIICEDDHTFTEHYSKEYLMKDILEAHEEGIMLLSGGIGNFGHAIQVAENRFWVSFFWSTQFLVLYRSIFKLLLDEPFDDSVTADGLLSALTSNKAVLFPFISSQKYFGYSDISNAEVRAINQVPDIFDKTASRIMDIKKVLSGATMNNEHTYAE